MNRPIILFGATASGKTGAVFHLARTLSPQSLAVISADSRQLYRGFDIGTAKPSPTERGFLPHYLVDGLEPEERFSVGGFVSACDELVPRLFAEGRVPIISGGTAFYIHGYLYGLPRTPVASPEIRTALEQELAERGLAALRAELRQVDPLSDARIAANDRYRVLRALEVYRCTGSPLSAVPVPDRMRPGLKPLVIGLHRERPELYRRIDLRVREMMEAGLPAEVEQLLAAGVSPEVPAFQSIGYREFPEIGGLPPWNRASLEKIEETIARNSRRYAKRQETFFRRLREVRWIPAEDHDTLEQMVREHLSATP